MVGMCAGHTWLPHVVIAAVSILLHRSQAHRAVDLHPIVIHRYDVLTRFVRSVRDDSAAEIAKLKAGANLTNSWSRFTAGHEQLLEQPQAWCKRAEDGGIQSPKDFSVRLRRYA